MALARWQATIVDGAGNVQPGASIEVRSEVGGAPLVTLYSDRAGTTLLGNPVGADADGFAAFHVAGGAYRITATKGGFSREWRYVPIGLAGESDGATSGVAFSFDAGVTDADPGTGELRFNNATPGLATQIFISDVNADGVNVSAWPPTWDDAGTASDRGILILQGAGGTPLLVARVTGTIVDGGVYSKVPITVISAAGTFAAGARLGAMFASSGISGLPLPLSTSGDRWGTMTTTASDGITEIGFGIDFHGSDADSADFNYRIDTFSSPNGLSITKAGGAPAVIAQAGKQSIWVPAAAFVVLGASPTLNTIQPGGILGATYKTLDFDPTIEEVAYFSVQMPKSWNVGTFTFQAIWSHAAAATNFGVTMHLYAMASGDNDSLLLGAIGPGFVQDTGGTANTQYTTPESAAFSAGGTPVAGDVLTFRIGRASADAFDTLAVDMRLHGLTIFYTTNAPSDA